MTYGIQDPYEPMTQVDEQAAVTGMLGGVDPGASSRRGTIFTNPTKGLFALWVLVIVTYMTLGYFFRGYKA